MSPPVAYVFLLFGIFEGICSTEGTQFSNLYTPLCLFDYISYDNLAMHITVASCIFDLIKLGNRPMHI